MACEGEQRKENTYTTRVQAPMRMFSRRYMLACQLFQEAD